jgi:hypothetical protein
VDAGLSFLTTLALRPATARLIDVGSTLTSATGLNNQQSSGIFEAASSNGSIE